MAKAPQTAVVADAIVFELERFELSDDDRLRLTGRWFGVRGRRFMRPTLTLDLDGEHIRALADLDDKPWAAEDGEPWTASFPWRKAAAIEEPELSVAPDIAIQLPAPSSRRTRSQRLAALPRRDAMTASWGDLAAVIQAEPETSRDAPSQAEPEPLEEAPPAPPAPKPDPLKSELDAVRDELEAVRGELEAARRQLRSRGDEAETAQAEVEATRTAREAALRSAAEAEAERETALTRAAEAEAERDALTTEKAELSAALEQSRATLERLGRERDEVAVARGAALVMRGATQAPPTYERHVGWLRRALALLVLVGVVLAALIVLNVL